MSDFDALLGADADYNECVITLSFAPDKWVGLEGWREDVALLVQLADRLGMNDGRRTAKTETRTVGTEEDQW